MKKKILSILLILVMSFAMISSAAIMASALEEQYDVTYGGTIGTYLSVNFSYTANPGEDYVFSFSSSDFYEPVNLRIYVNDVELSSNLWSYDKELRECVIYAEAITGDILIYAEEKEIKAIPSVVDDVSFVEEDEITVGASFFLWNSDVSFDAPKLFEVVDGVEQNAKDTTCEYDNVSQNITVSYTFSKDDFSADGTKTYKFGLLVDDEWYYTNEFTVTYRQERFTYDVEYCYDTFTYEVMPYNVGGEEKATEGMQYSAVIDILPGCTFNNIVVKRGGAVVLTRDVDYSFNESSGLLIIEGEEITEDIQIFIYVDGTPESADITVNCTNAQTVSAPDATIKKKTLQPLRQRANMSFPRRALP